MVRYKAGEYNLVGDALLSFSLVILDSDVELYESLDSLNRLL